MDILLNNIHIDSAHLATMFIIGMSEYVYYNSILMPCDLYYNLYLLVIFKYHFDQVVNPVSAGTPV